MLGRYLSLIVCCFCVGILNAKIRYLKRPFQTDKCTGWLNGDGKVDWSRCCVIHDLYMWGGGTKEHRLRADQNLRKCIQKAGSPFHAEIMYNAVRLGQRSPVSFKGKRWGHAWPDQYRYLSLGQDDIEVLRSHLENSQVTEIGDDEFRLFLLDIENLNSN